APRPSRPARRRTRLGLEALEGREVPAVLTVTTLFDEDDGVNVGKVSLRHATNQAKSQSGKDNSLIHAAEGGSELTKALPDREGELAINGPEADRLTVLRNTDQECRIFTVAQGADVEISGLTVSKGRISSYGGGIKNDGTLTMTGCAVSDCSAVEV